MTVCCAVIIGEWWYSLIPRCWVDECQRRFIEYSLFRCYKVVWWHLCVVGNFVSTGKHLRPISSEFCIPKITNIGWFFNVWPSYSHKNAGVRVLGLSLYWHDVVCRLQSNNNWLTTHLPHCITLHGGRTFMEILLSLFCKKRRISHVTLKFDFCSWPWQVEINHYAKTTSKVISMKDRLIRELVRPRSRNFYAHLGHTNWPVIVRFLDRCPRNLPTKIWCGHSFLGLYLAKVSSGGSVAEWLASWTQAPKGLGSNRSRGAVG